MRNQTSSIERGTKYLDEVRAGAKNLSQGRNDAAKDSANTTEVTVEQDMVSESASSTNGFSTASPDQSTPSHADDNSESVLAAVARLSALHPLEYEKVREAEAARLNARIGVLDQQVSISRRTTDAEGDKPAMFPTVTPWPDPVDGAELLSEIVDTVQRFIVCDRETAVAVALWIAFTWLIDHVQVAPLAVITAPERRCGKTQMLSLIACLSRRPLIASNISPAATFRAIEAYGPTLLIDEADAFLRDNEELRSVINSGHTRQAAFVIRSVGDDHEPYRFNTWCAKAIAGIGTLTETIMDRAIVLELRRKLPSESVERLRHAEAGLFERLVFMLARFAEDAAPAIERSRPELPRELNDRAQDNWEPLLAIADHVGGEWPRLARATALRLSGANEKAVARSAELLADIREVFAAKKVDRISTADLLQALIADELKPWATCYRDKPMSARQLAKRLEQYGVSSKNIRFGHEDVLKGFWQAQFDDAFARYLPPPVSSAAATTLSSAENEAGTAGYRVADSDPGSATDSFAATSKPAPVLVRSGVASRTPVVTQITLKKTSGADGEPVSAFPSCEGSESFGVTPQPGRVPGTCSHLRKDT